MNEELLRGKISRAQRIKDLAFAEGGLFAIFDAVEKNYVETLLRSDIEDAALREKAFHRVNALRDVRRVMELAISEGRSADAIIKKLSRPQTGRRIGAKV